jgi:hypothetical protein
MPYFDLSILVVFLTLYGFGLYTIITKRFDDFDYSIGALSLSFCNIMFIFTTQDIVLIWINFISYFIFLFLSITAMFCNLRTKHFHEMFELIEYHLRNDADDSYLVYLTDIICPPRKKL